MKVLKLLPAAAGAVLLSAGSASAMVVDSFTFTDVDSISGMETGIATGDYTVAGYRVSGTLTEIQDSTWAGEAEIDATVNGVTRRLRPFFGEEGFTGSVSVTDNETVTLPTAVMAGDVFSFDFLETFDDASSGDDATWDSITIEVLDASGGTFLTKSGLLGEDENVFFELTVLAGGEFQIDTGGSMFDTELGIWDAAGMLLDENDDDGSIDGGEYGESLLILDLDPGEYTIGLGGFDTEFDDGPTMEVDGSSEGGSYVLNIHSVDGEAEFPDDTGAEGVPEPVTGVLGVMGLGALAGITRRRKA